MAKIQTLIIVPNDIMHRKLRETTFVACANPKQCNKFGKWSDNFFQDYIYSYHAINIASLPNTSHTTYLFN